MSDNASGDILEHLVSHPEYKLLTALNIPQMSEVSKQFSTFHWASQLKHLRQMLIASAVMEEGKGSLGYFGESGS